MGGLGLLLLVEHFTDGEQAGSLARQSPVLARHYGAAASRLAAKFGLNPPDRNGLPVVADGEPDPMEEPLSR